MIANGASRRPIQQVAEAESLPPVNEDEDSNATIGECMLLGEELVGKGSALVWPTTLGLCAAIAPLGQRPQAPQSR